MNTEEPRKPVRYELPKPWWVEIKNRALKPISPMVFLVSMLGIWLGGTALMLLVGFLGKP